MTALQFKDVEDRFYRDRIAFWRAKLNLPSTRWDSLWREQHNVGFMVAGAVKADILNDFREAVDKAIERGETLDQFRKRFDEIVQRHGWQYNGTRNWRSKVIYQTNLRTSHAAGRYRQMKDPAMVKVRPFWQYRHNDRVSVPRPQHVAWDGLVLRHDDPWWLTHYPPGGYGCRCFVRALGKREMARMGKLAPDQTPPTQLRTIVRKATGERLSVPLGIDPGFDYVPGRESVSERARRVFARKVRGMNSPIGAFLLDWIRQRLPTPPVDGLPES